MSNDAPTRGPISTRGLLFLFSIALLLAAVIAFPFLTAETRAGGAASPVALAADSPEDLGELGDFALTERSGKSVSRASLLGRAWIAGFVFTRCSGPCPRVTANMRRLQDLLKGTQAKLITFSVDPDYDSPEVLGDYAESVGADPERWWMLTGSKATVDALIPSFVPKTQRLAEGEAPVGEHVAHQTRLWVIDAKGRIRGLYAGESDQDLDLIAARVRHVEGEGR